MAKTLFRQPPNHVASEEIQEPPQLSSRTPYPGLSPVFLPTYSSGTVPLPGDQPGPDLSSRTPYPDAPPVVLAVPFTGAIPHAGEQPTPKFTIPRPVDDSVQAAQEVFDVSGYAAEWEAAIDRQKQFFKTEVPKIAANMVARALPRPGNIDPDLLPSTIATKALAAVANKVSNLENKYVFEPVSNAGAAVSRKLTNILVNTAPEGAYINSKEASSLQLINKAGAANRGLSLSNIFANDKVTLNSTFKRVPQLDPKQSLMNDANSSQFMFDDSRGQLRAGANIGDAAAGTYFPFYITDLRPTSDGNYRTVFFKPFNLEISENFAPNWNLQNFMGRVDPVATYQNTTRNLNVSFKMVAQHPSDLKVIYNKLNWLSSMVYPEYGANMRYRSGPVVRMRIGDIINARSSLIPDTKDRPGVTGILMSLDFNYVPLWEIEDNWQLAREVDISFSFTVLHELPVGVLNGEFGTIGSIDANGVFMSPQQALDNKVAGANDQTPTDEKDYVDSGGFRKYGGK